MLSLLLVVIYLSFISLGLPDPLLGAAWPSMHADLGAQLSWSGAIFIIISCGTVISSLQSDRLTKRFGAAIVTAASVGMTALALWGFSISTSFAMLCLWAIPYGLGAGSVDSALNNFVALHYASRHMSWLHCMWGLGTTVGPLVLSQAMAAGLGWQGGYRHIAIMQAVLTAILVLSLPLWRRADASSPSRTHDRAAAKPMPLREVIRIPGVKLVVVCFFLYCGLEQTVMLWGSTFLVQARDIDATTAASFASLFSIGITAGRALSGLLTLRLSDEQLVRAGIITVACGIALIAIPGVEVTSLMGLVLIGLGCAPIYPCLIHSTPKLFGARNSQAVMGVQMACAFCGPLIVAPLFGRIATRIGFWLLPLWLAALLALLLFLHTRLIATTSAR